MIEKEPLIAEDECQDENGCREQQYPNDNEKVETPVHGRKISNERMSGGVNAFTYDFLYLEVESMVLCIDAFSFFSSLAFGSVAPRPSKAQAAWEALTVLPL